MPDRSLADQRGVLETAIREELLDFQPDLVLCPSPVEIHPDHRALARALYEEVAASRAGDPDHDRFRFLRIAFYELSHPLLPNALVDIAAVADRKDAALAAYVSQQAVRDYAGAMRGLNAYRRLTLPGRGPVEAFRVVTYAEASTTSLEELRRAIGPSLVTDGGRGPAPVSVVVRTRNRPALLREALESLRAQTARPRQVVVVNDGGASPREVTDGFRDAFDLHLEEPRQRRGRSAAANRGVAVATRSSSRFSTTTTAAFPTTSSGSPRASARARSPSSTRTPSRSSTARAKPGGSLACARSSTRSTSTPTTSCSPTTSRSTRCSCRASSSRKVGGFDEGLDYSEDWDFLIRLSAETPFRHLRAVTCEYRVFEASANDPTHVASGGGAFQDARRKIFERYAARRTDAGLARVLDRMRSQVAFWYDRDGISQGELKYLRESHRRITESLGRSERERQSERARLTAENELLHARLAEVFAKNEEYDGLVVASHVEIERLNSLLNQIYASRTWKLHLFLDKLRGRR